MFFLPGHHKEQGLAYSPLKALISPRPIGWISSLSADGTANLAPYSFFNAIAESPPMVMFISSPDLRDDNQDGHKDSVSNILETREFGVNIVGMAQSEQMVKSSQTVEKKIDEFDYTGLLKKTARTISVPLVDQAPAHLECVYYDHIVLPDDGKGRHSIMLMGRIVGIHIDERNIENGKVNISKYQPVARLGYKEYAVISDKFEMSP